MLCFFHVGSIVTALCACLFVLICFALLYLVLLCLLCSDVDSELVDVLFACCFCPLSLASVLSFSVAFNI